MATRIQEAEAGRLGSRTSWSFSRNPEWNTGSSHPTSGHLSKRIGTRVPKSCECIHDHRSTIHKKARCGSKLCVCDRWVTHGACHTPELLVSKPEKSAVWQRTNMSPEGVTPRERSQQQTDRHRRLIHARDPVLTNTGPKVEPAALLRTGGY